MCYIDVKVYDRWKTRPKIASESPEVFLKKFLTVCPISYRIYIRERGRAQGNPKTRREHTMTTKTIDTNKYGKIDIRKTSEKLTVMVNDKVYERVAWEDTNAGYWVKVNGYWYHVSNLAIAAQKRLGNRFACTELATYGI